MIHRFALLFGGTGAAGVLALALAMGGVGGRLAITNDALNPLSQSSALGGGAAQPEVAGPSDAPALGGGSPITVVDKVYVVPANVKPDKQADPPRHPRGDNNRGDSPAADESNDDSSANDGNHDGDTHEGDDANENEAEDANEDESGEADEDHANEDEDHANEDDPSRTGDHANEDSDHAAEDNGSDD